MIEVKNPVLLNADLTPKDMLRPDKGSLKFQMVGARECTLTLPDDSPDIVLHDWIQVWYQNGFAGYFRMTSGGNNIGKEQQYTFKHGIDILADSIWDAETEFEGTKAQFLSALLDKQTHLINGVKPWVLGTCADSSTVKKEINYDNLQELFEGLEDESSDYYFTYNQDVWPWQVSLIAKTSTVQSEFRLTRNMDKCNVSWNDAELCTRLILNINAMVMDQAIKTATGKEIDQNQSIYKTYNNTAAQAIYGIIVKTADIDTEDDLAHNSTTEADAWAADFLAKRADPILQIQIDGQELKARTGDDWDENKIGTICRVAVPRYSKTFEERVFTVTYPDFLKTPDQVTVSLANALPEVTSSVKKMATTVSKQGRGGRGSARKEESFDKHFEITDNSGNVLRQAGMHLDANGLLVYADDNVNMVGARFNVQADKIGMVVGTNQQGNFIKAAEIAVAINDAGQGVALINADHVNISATSTAHTLAGELEYTQDGKLVIKNAGGLYVRKTVSGVTAEYGVWEANNLTAGVIATIVNGEASTLIKGTKIQIGTNDTVGTWISGKTYLNDVTADYIDGKISNLATLHAKDISCNNITAGTNIYGPNGLSLYANGVWTITLTDNGNNTYTLAGTKLNGTAFSIGTFSRGGGEADRIAGWNDYWNTGWKVPTDSDSGGKFMVPSTKSSDGSWSYQEWSRAFNSVVWSIAQSPYVQSSQPSGYTNLGTVGVSSSCYIYFKIKANGATKNYYIYARV